MLSGTDQLDQLQAAFLVEGIELAEPIGQGGSATVWGARWRSREVAVKVAEQADCLARAPRLEHPGILNELARGSVLGRPYAVLDRFPGDLAGMLRGGPLPRRLRRPVLLQLLDALDYAHQRGTVHGDLKPANVLVDPAARPVRVALTDFGQVGRAPEAALEASMLSSDRQGEQTYATLAYLAPERLEGAEPSLAADLYSFGVLLFELLTGRLPQGLELPSELQRGLDRRFDALVKRCLSRDPGARPAANAVRREVLGLCPPGGKATRSPSSEPLSSDAGMVLIPGGFLVIGDREEPSASPVHERQLSPFWIDRHPVTNRRYLAYVLATKAKRPPSWPKRGRLRPQLLDLPVTGIDWDEALNFARWEGKRLPTEFEWERAAQGPEQRSQPYGEVFDPSRVQAGLGPVGEAGASSEGVCDLTGNGWEWTASAFGPYPNPSPHTELRTLRGGLDPARGRASAHLRAGLRRDARDALVTFRCARDVQQKAR